MGDDEGFDDFDIGDDALDKKLAGKGGGGAAGGGAKSGVVKSTTSSNSNTNNSNSSSVPQTVRSNSMSNSQSKSNTTSSTGPGTVTRLGQSSNNNTSSSSSSSSSSNNNETKIATERIRDEGELIRLLEQLCSQFLEACAKEGDGSGSGSGNGGVETTEAGLRLNALRKAILFHGIPHQDKIKCPGGVTLRGKIWKLLLPVPQIDAQLYLNLISRGECEKYGTIRSDSFRTFRSDKAFQLAVPEPEIIRVLNSFVHQYSPSFTYCQGMNTICGPFLFCLPELDAYFAFCQFLVKRFPLYWVSSHIGAQAGCMLVERCLEVVDPPLHTHLKKCGLHAYVYAFSCVSSLSSSARPFKQVLRLWDFLISFGPHLNILCVVAQIVAIREKLMKTDTPKQYLDYRHWPRLRARMVISLSLSFKAMIPDQLYREMALHGVDAAVVSTITGRPMHGSGPKASLALPASAVNGGSLNGQNGPAPRLGTSPHSDSEGFSDLDD